MNLTNEEAQEINRRVALALKWSGLESAEAYIAECWPDGLPMGEAYFRITDHGGWFGWPPNARRYETEIGRGVMPDREPVPDFCRDPAAADLVRQEIERRGWWTIIKGGQGAGRWHVEIDIGHPSGMGPDLVGYGDLWTALCLAFLAAHDAKAEDRARAALEATKPT